MARRQRERRPSPLLPTHNNPQSTSAVDCLFVIPQSPASSPQIEAPLATNFTAALMGKGMAKWMGDGGLDLGLGWDLAIHLEVLVQRGPVQPIAASPSF